MVESEGDETTGGESGENLDEARPGAGGSRRNECPRIVSLSCAVLEARVGRILTGEAQGSYGKSKNHERGPGDGNGTGE